MLTSTYYWSQSPVTKGLVEQRSGRKTVEDIVQSEELLPLQSVTQDTPVPSPRGVLRDLEITAVHVNRKPNLEKE